MPLVTLDNKTKNIPIPIDLDDFDGPADECRDCRTSKDPSCCEHTECWDRPGGCAEGCELASGPGSPCHKKQSNINPLISKCGSDDDEDAEYKNKGCWVWDKLDKTCITYGKSPDPHIKCEYEKCTDCFLKHPTATKIKKKQKDTEEPATEEPATEEPATEEPATKDKNTTSTKGFFSKPEGIVTIIGGVVVVILIIVVICLAIHKK